MQQNRSTIQIAENSICENEPFTWKLAATHPGWGVGINVSLTRYVASASQQMWDVQCHEEIQAGVKAMQGSTSGRKAASYAAALRTEWI